MIETPFTKIGIAEKIWNLRDSNPSGFKKQVLEYLDKGYAGWHLVRLERPFALCEDRRIVKKKK